MIIFGPKETPEGLEEGQKSHEGVTSPGGMTTPRPHLPGLWPPRGPNRRNSTAINSYKFRNPQKKPRSGVPPPQASVATKNQSGARSGTLPEGESISGGHLHHPGDLHDEEGVVLPRGWGYVPVAMCLISLSRVLEMSWSRCTMGFATIVGSYDVLPPLPSCNELSFPFEVILSDWVFENTWCMSCTCLSAVINLRVCDIGNLCIWVGTRLIHVSTRCMFWWSTCGFVTLGTYA